MRELVTIGAITLYWYGLLYVVAFALAYFLLARLQKYRGLALSLGQLLELVAWGAVGVVVGGRLGYVLLYEPLYYWAHPLEILDLSAGGMSSHGGFVGVGVAMGLFAIFTPPSLLKAGHLPLLRGGKLAYFAILDLITVPAALGLSLGRVGNLINQELYVTPLARVAAVASPLLLVALSYWALKRRPRVGTALGVFLVWYSLFRFGEEYLREPQWLLGAGYFTWGQVYTLPLLLAGLYLLKDEAKRRGPREI